MPDLYPCDFPIKIMGRTAPGFAETVAAIVRSHCQDVVESQVRVNTSRGGNYVSVTLTIQARSRAQLDALYSELHAHERVLMVL